MRDSENDDKVFWPDEGFTKGDLAAYYEAVAPVMLPHMRDRPVTVRLFPDGIRGEAFYRRERPDDAPAWMRSVTYRPVSVSGVRHLILIDDAEGLRWWVARGAIEFHTWGARRPEVTAPDQAIFDLDPGEEAGFSDVLAAALHLRDHLAEQGLTGFPKTSGGRGMHVEVPLAKGHTFEQVRAWVRAAAEKLAENHPGVVAAAHGATHRGRLVTVDHAQNSVGRNTAAPYTVRGRPGAPVSAPVTWAEVARGAIRPEHFTLRTMPGRIQKKGDLYAGMLEKAYTLPLS